MKENILKRFGYVESKNNNETVQKIGEISIEENGDECILNKKWMEVIGKYIWACGVDKGMIKYREGLR